MRSDVVAGGGELVLALWLQSLGEAIDRGTVIKFYG